MERLILGSAGRPIVGRQRRRFATLALCLLGPLSTAAAQRGSQVDLVVAATTDVHGRVRGWDYYANAADPARSLAGAATIVDSLRKANPGRVLLVDGGDLLQGNPFTFVAAKVSDMPVHPVIAAMNVMQYDAAVLGNHEFNYGVPLLRRAVAQAGFPFLAANVRDASTRPLAAPFTVVTREVRRGDVVRIGIVGATTPGAMVWDAENLKAARITVTDIVPAVRASVAELRRRKADIIVVLLHSGLSEAASYDTTATGLPSENVAARVPREIDGIDLVVYGHSHRELVDSTINGALLVQPRNWAASVAVATLTLSRDGGRWHVASHRGQSVAVAGRVESPAVLGATTASHRATLAWANAPIGRTAVRWAADSARVADMPITDLINAVMLRETGAQLSATAAFSLDASLDTGNITLAALSKLYPYDNTLRSLKVTGAQVRAFLEHSARYYRSVDASGRAPANGIVDANVPGFNFDVLAGAEYVLDLRQPIGARVTSLQYQGKPMSATDTFTLALNNYRAGGGGGFAMLAGAPVVYQRDVDIRQLVIDEVRRVASSGKPLNPSDYAQRNWQLVPSEAVASAYAEQVRGRSAEQSGRPPASAASASAAASGAASAAHPSASVTGRRVRVIAFSDFHAAMRARPDESGRTMGGAVALSAAIRRAERECTGECQSIVVHAGDLFTGTPASDWNAGRPTVAVMNRLHVAAGALGNHEFDFGQDTLRRRAGELTHRLLAVNLRDRDGRTPSWVRADTVVTRGGVRIGIVGAAGMVTPKATRRRNVANLTFLEPAPLMSARIKALRDAGAQVVIGVIHDGGRCERATPAVCTGDGINVAQALTERPDAFVIGHSHVNVNMRVRDFPVVEPASSGRAIQIIDIPLNGGTAAMTLREVSGADTEGADPVVDSIVRASVASVAERMARPVATIAEAMPRRGNQYALGNLIADAARTMGNGDFGMWNNGGIRTDVPAGPLAFGGVHEISPFGNQLVRLRLRGSQLRESIERGLFRGRPDAHVSGLQVEFDSSRPNRQRVVRLTTTAGVPIDDAKLYTLVINDFMLDDPESETPMTGVVTDILPIRDIDAVAGYLQRLPQPVRGDTVPRIRDVSARIKP